MKESKDIEKLKEQFLNIFSSSINLNNLSRFTEEDIAIKSPPIDELQLNNNKTGFGSNKEININVNVEGANGNTVNEYKKVVVFNNNTNTYDVKLKKNKPVDQILNSTFIRNITPLNINKIVNPSNNLQFNNNFILTQAQKKKKEKGKKPVESMNFIFDTPYSFYTNTGNYYIKNTQNNLNKNKTNNYYSNSTVLSRQDSRSIVRDTNSNITSNENNYTSINPSENIQNNYTSINPSENIQNNYTSINPSENIFEELINNNISSLTRNEDGTVSIQNKIEKSINTENITNKTLLLKNEPSNTLVNNDQTNIFNTKNIELNKQTENKIFKHNITQLDDPSYSFTNKEQYITIDKSKGETLQDIKKLTFNELNQRTVNRVQAKTITYNKENKIVVPAFAGGGEGIVSSTTPIVVGERGTESFQVIPQKDSGSAISSNPAASLRGEAPAEIKAGSNDKVSKAIEDNVTKKKELNSDKALETNKNNDTKDMISELKNAGGDITPDKGKRKSTARPASIKTDNKSLIIESFKRTAIGVMPVWRTQHM
jgi:hypothetical protein